MQNMKLIITDIARQLSSPKMLKKIEKKCATLPGTKIYVLSKANASKKELFT